MTLVDHTIPAVNDNPHWQGYRCVVCGRTYGPDHATFVCNDCGVDGILDVVYDYDGIRAELEHRRKNGSGTFDPAGAGGLWRFAPLLPIQVQGDDSAWTLGDSPLHPAPRLAQALGLGDLVLKDDTHLPSASLKDRAAAVAVARARQLGIDHLACASTGNAAASLAVLCARAGLSCTIFVPADAPRAKLAQLLLHGARVVPVDGTYDQAFDLSIAEIAAHGWYSRNCAHNPLLVEGKKTAALEMAHALTRAFSEPDRLPDAVFVPVGDGCIVSSVAKALDELHRLGLIAARPRVIGVQAAGSAPLARAWQDCDRPQADLTGPEILARIHTVRPHTVADSICVGVPRNRVKAWQHVSHSNGAFVSVTDEEIIAAVAKLASLAGVFAEPSGAAGLAGVSAALKTGLIEPGASVAVLVTGNGLKDPEAALGTVDIPAAVPPLAG